MLLSLTFTLLTITPLPVHYNLTPPYSAHAIHHLHPYPSTHSHTLFTPTPNHAPTLPPQPLPFNPHIPLPHHPNPTHSSNPLPTSFTLYPYPAYSIQALPSLSHPTPTLHLSTASGKVSALYKILGKIHAFEKGQRRVGIFSETFRKVLGRTGAFPGPSEW